MIPLQVPRAALLSAVMLTVSTVITAHGQIPDLAQRKKARQVFVLTSAQFLEDKDRAKARLGYIEAIRLYPRYAQPRYNLGVLAEADENWTEATKWFTEYLRFDRRSPYAAKARAELTRIRRIQLQDATAEGRKRRQYNDVIFRGRLLLNIGDAKAAVAEAATAAKIDDARWEAYALTADALSRQEVYIEAATFLEQAIERAPPGIRSRLQHTLSNYPRQKQYRSLGRAGAQALKARRYREAAANFISAWRLFPNRDEYGIAAALAYAIAGEKAKAEALLTMLDHGPSPVTAKKIKEIRAKLARL